MCLIGGKLHGANPNFVAGRAGHAVAIASTHPLQPLVNMAQQSGTSGTSHKITFAADYYFDVIGRVNSK